MLCNIAPAPALGTTGCNLDKYFLELLNSKISEYRICDGEYNVILANAIQYQCSLGVDTKIYRDRVWLDLWLFKGFNKKAITRLQSYKPDIIINFCTEGSHLKDHLRPNRTKTVINKKYVDSINKGHSIAKTTTLRELVSNELRNNFNILILEGNHPSSWEQNPNNRTLKK